MLPSISNSLLQPSNFFHIPSFEGKRTYVEHSISKLLSASEFSSATGSIVCSLNVFICAKRSPLVRMSIIFWTSDSIMTHCFPSFNYQLSCQFFLISMLIIDDNFLLLPNSLSPSLESSEIKLWEWIRSRWEFIFCSLSASSATIAQLWHLLGFIGKFF